MAITINTIPERMQINYTTRKLSSNKHIIYYIYQFIYTHIYHKYISRRSIISRPSILTNVICVLYTIYSAVYNIQCSILNSIPCRIHHEHVFFLMNQRGELLKGFEKSTLRKNSIKSHGHIHIEYRCFITIFTKALSLQSYARVINRCSQYYFYFVRNRFQFF